MRITAVPTAERLVLPMGVHRNITRISARTAAEEAVAPLLGPLAGWVNQTWLSRPGMAPDIVDNRARFAALSLGGVLFVTLPFALSSEASRRIEDAVSLGRANRTDRGPLRIVPLSSGFLGELKADAVHAQRSPVR